MILGRIDPRLFDELLVEMAVGAFERTHEGAVLRPALPFGVLDRVGVFLRRLIMAEPGNFVLQHAGHGALPLSALCADRLGDFRRARNDAPGLLTAASVRSVLARDR